MKKLTAIIMALVMAMSLSVASYAGTTGGEAEQNNPGVITNGTPTQDTKVKVNVSEYFEWTVPAEIELTKGTSYNEYSGSGDVTFANVLLCDGNEIKVTISGIDTILGNTYTMTIGGNAPATGATIAAAGSLTADASMTATVATGEEASDTVTFTAAIEKA